ncbi:MAG TPA: DUF1707 domain-containing protein, partial [Trebonia sp.]|nr:DUF1707 domain-containing protein [Trebonia sp.]
MAAGNEMRVSDAEREAAAAELREHFASGRLDSDELEERLATVFAAKTRGDLSAVFTDLPSSGRSTAGAGRPVGPGSAGAFGGPFSGEPFGAGPFGISGPRASDRDGSWHARGGPFRASAGRIAAQVIVTSVLIWALLIVGILGIFGLGTGRP